LAQNGHSQTPIAKKLPHTTQVHGYTLKDDYFWPREKKYREVLKYLEAENANNGEVMKPTKELQRSALQGEALKSKLV
jgi:oligopeptidase B